MRDHFFHKLIAIVSFCALLSSCKTSQMQIVSLECNKLTKDTAWYYSDSLVKIAYFYYTRGGGIAFLVANVSDKPVFLDGKNSFILVGNKKLAYWQDVEQVNGTLEFRNNTHFYKAYDPINATISRPERIAMIPPKSSIIINKFWVHEKTMFDLTRYTPQIDSVPVNWQPGSKKKTPISKVSFQESNSPEVFRHFLTMSTTEDFKNPFYYDFNFWISEIWQMDARQATGSDFPMDYANGPYAIGDKRTEKYHPYKKNWRFYLNNFSQ